MTGPDHAIVNDFGTPDAVTTFLDGSTRSVAQIGPTWVGRGRYLPGWRWSHDVKPMHGQPSGSHAGYVLSGALAVRDPSGVEVVVRSRQAFYATPGHDAWVIGDEPCEALDFPVVK